MIKQLSTAIQTLELTIFSLMVPYGEYIQNEVLLKHRTYNWGIGHYTDIGFSGGLVTFAMMKVEKKEKLKYALNIPTLFSGIEAIVSLHPKINFDWQDVACYYGTALLAYGINKLCDRVAKTD